MVGMLPRSLGVTKEVSDGITLLNMCLHRKCANPESMLWSFVLLIVVVVDAWMFPSESKSTEKHSVSMQREVRPIKSLLCKTIYCPVGKSVARRAQKLQC